MLVCCVIVILASGVLGSTRERKLLDFGWRFHLGNSADISYDFGYGVGYGFAKAGAAGGPADPSFDDQDWRLVNLPHDWAVELPFSIQGPNELHVQHGYKPIGRAFPATTIGWYRRAFDVPAGDQGKRLSLEFDGVFRNSLVWLNGHLLGRHESGYSSFAYDISDVVNFGDKNTLVVRVDASQYEGWFYEGAGIYRHVWLVKTSPVHVAHWGTYVVSEVGNGDATITVQTEIANDSNSPATITQGSAITDPEGKAVANVQVSGIKLAAWASQTLTQKVKIPKPALWSIEQPNLYKLTSTITGSSTADDSYETTFGIRTISFDPDKGFFLNGKRVEIKGMCNHQDHAGVGSALLDRLQEYRIERLKDMGCNAYRTSHNPPTPELLDASDRLGMLVMDENRLLDSSAIFQDDLAGQIRRDRNHPSVILWSIGNEEMEQGNSRGKRISETLSHLVHSLDPTRPVTYAGNNGNEYEGVNGIVDVRGWNYLVLGDIDKYHADHPKQPMFGSEEASTLSTRGEYKTDPATGYMSSYDTEKPGWGTTAEQWWTYYAARPYLAGAFVWTGFDYRGEPTPYEWPCISSHFGVMDTCGFPKDNFYYYQAWWSGKDVLHILPHWNWAGKEGQPISVWVYSNLDEVELFLNGKSLGRKPMPPNGHLEWAVNYASGTLEARGYRKGQVVKTEKVESTGAPAKLVLTPDRPAINADGEDVSVLNVSAVDSDGRVVPTADNDVTFQVTGGQVIGVGNGNPTDHGQDKFFGEALDFRSFGWRIEPGFDKDPDPLGTTDFDDSDWRQVDIYGKAEQIPSPNSVAAFRGYIDMPGWDAGTKITFIFSHIADQAKIYLNGKFLGETNDPKRVYRFEPGKFATPGRNVLVLLVKSGKGAGGIGGGITAVMQRPLPNSHRLLFHGLCQAIVQGTATPGTIHVRATSPGLPPAEIDIKANPAAFRGYGQ